MNDQMKFDVRLFEYKIRTGETTSEEWQKHLDSLPDCADNALELDIESSEYPDDNLH